MNMNIISDMMRTGKTPPSIYRTAAADLLTEIQLEAIRMERERQDAKWGEQNHEPPKWLGILGEEFGELCQAVNETVLDSATKRERGGYENMRREAIHVAAVAVGFLECLDRQVIRGAKK